MKKATSFYDVLIIGAGIAGLSQAIRLAEKEQRLSIAVLSKKELIVANTHLAQGGIAAVMDEEKDSFQNHIEDTINASQRKAEPEIVEYVVKNAPQAIHQLEKWGVQFDQENNTYHAGLEGGHSHPRVVHVKDQTGAAIHDELIKKVHSFTKIAILEHQEAVELFTNEQNEAAGVLVFHHQTQQTSILQAKSIVLATGGIGQLFEYTTNTSIATGDGIMLAKEIGAKISNISAIQFHPTAIAESNKERLFLISEAVRGAGAHIINKKGERFIFDSDKRGELATRDIVSKAIHKEINAVGNKGVFLDCSPIQKEVLKQEFPFIVDYCRSIGYDIFTEPIPILPAAHYSCGGIEANENGATSVPFLFAIGECANTGLHGNNRLASNSLLEAVVFTENVSEAILSSLTKEKESLGEIELTQEVSNQSPRQFDFEINRLKHFLSHYFISKNAAEMDVIKTFILKYKTVVKNYPSHELSVIQYLRRMNLMLLILKELDRAW